MKATWLQRLDQLIRHLLPALLTLMLVLMGAMPTHLPGFAEITPLLPLIGIYYWAIYRPDLLPASVAFGVGLMNDVLLGSPLGVSSTVYLLVQALTVSQRRFFLGKPFMVAWCCFGMVAAAALLLEWMLISMLFDHVMPALPVFFALLLTMAIYPVFSWLFGRTQAFIIRVE